MSDEMPPQPPTTRLEAVPPWAIELTRSMKEGFRVTNANIEMVSNDLSVLKERVSVLETERTKLSGGVRGLSSANMQQDAEILAERQAREALTTKVDKLSTAVVDIVVPILQRINDLTKNPLVKILVVIATAVAGSYAASKGLK
jgi:chaperonin GroEL (HSP60 family)